MPDETTLVVLSDLHVGSRSAISPIEFERCDGSRHRASAPQRALYEAWEALASDWRKPDIMVINGDAIEGQARKESGVPCWTSDMDEQIEACVELLELWKPESIYILNGSGYHVDAGGKSLENHLAKAVGAEKIGAGKGQVSDDELFLRVADTTFHFSHHIQVGTGWYRTTPLARECVFALLNESHKHRCDVIARAHVHSFTACEFSRQYGFTSPCWQLQTRYMKKKSPLGMVPDIGAIRFRIQSNGIPHHYAKDKRFFRPDETKPKLITYEKE